MKNKFAYSVTIGTLLLQGCVRYTSPICSESTRVDLPVEAVSNYVGKNPYVSGTTGHPLTAEQEEKISKMTDEQKQMLAEMQQKLTIQIKITKSSERVGEYTIDDNGSVRALSVCKPQDSRFQDEGVYLFETAGHKLPVESLDKWPSEFSGSGKARYGWVGGFTEEDFSKSFFEGSRVMIGGNSIDIERAQADGSAIAKVNMRGDLSSMFSPLWVFNDESSKPESLLSVIKFEKYEHLEKVATKP